ncbi:MAG: response regulator [Deferribacterales bacterium]
MKNILVVEDSKFFQNVIENELKELEYNITIASSIKEAEEILNKNSFDLITLDVELPDGLGYDLCRKLKNDPYYNNTQIIIVTSSSDQESRKKSYEAGALVYIHKNN